MIPRSYLLERPTTATRNRATPDRPIVWSLPSSPDAFRALLDDGLVRGSTWLVWVPGRGPARILGWDRGHRSLLIRFGGAEAPLEPLSLDLLCSWAGDRGERAA